MKLIKIASACVVMTVIVAAAVASASYASPVNANGIAVFTRQGISPERAAQAIDVQDKVAQTSLVSNVEAALGSEFAGVWFDPAAAQLHIGVTSAKSTQAATQIVTQAGLSAGVVMTSVRSTWAALVAAQSEWDKKLAKLLTNQEATTGLDPQHNAVSITLSSSVPPAELDLLENEAANASVNVLVSVAPPSQFLIKPRAKKTCAEAFETLKAYCEETIISGVNLEFAEPECTAGPMLVEGNETYVITSGHCFGKGSAENGNAIAVAMFSKYPKVAEQKEVGKEGTWIETKARDMAKLKVKRPGSFTEALPIPVPALMAAWGSAKPSTPRAVEGVAEVVSGQAVCHEGMTSGEHCGEVTELNVTFATKEHLVKVTACGSKGDSGGPYFLAKTEEVLMLGIETAGPLPECHEEGISYTSYFEPLLDLSGAKGFGILSTFAGRLLTKANESRPQFLLAEWLVSGASVTASLPAQTSVTLLLEDRKATLGVKAMVLCSGILDGTIGPNGEDEVKELLSLAGVAVSLTALAGTSLLCSGQEGCTTGTENDEVWAVNLPWSTTLELVEQGAFTGFADLINPHSGGGKPGWYIKCATALGTSEDECTAEQGATEDSNLTGGVLAAFSEAFTILVGNPLANCTASAEKETGNIEESGEVTSSEGTLSVSST